MNSSEEQKLRRSEAIYMHDYVSCGDGSHGCIVGINRGYGEALINVYEDGEPTMRIKTVDIESVEQHTDGRVD